MARRRSKTSSWKTLPLWGISLALVGWGLWQAEMLRRSVVAEGVPIKLDAGMAIGPMEGATEGVADGGQDVRDTGVTLVDVSAWAPATVMPEVTAHLEPTPVFDAGLSGEELVAQGVGLLNAGKAAAGRFALNEALARTSDEIRAGELRGTLAALNMPVFLGTDILPDDPAARIVQIQPGDTFLSLGRAYGMPAAFLQKLNPALDARNLRLGAGVKIVQGPFHGRIIKHTGRLDLYARDIYVASCRVDFPEGNYLPRGDYQITAGTKLQLGSASAGRTWIGFSGLEQATEGVTNGWMFGAAGPRGKTAKDRATGIHLGDGDLVQLYNVLSEGRSHLRVEP